MVRNRVAEYYRESHQEKLEVGSDGLYEPLLPGIVGRSSPSSLEAPAIALYLPGMSTPVPPPITKVVVQANGLDLRSVYDRYLAPRHSTGTRSNYANTLRRWEEFVTTRFTHACRSCSAVCCSSSPLCCSCTRTTAAETTTDCCSSSAVVPATGPTNAIAIPADLLDDVLLEEWRDWRLAKPTEPSTVRKELTHLRAILRRAGRRESGNPRGLNLIDLVPVADAPRVDQSPRRLLSDKELRQLYAFSHSPVWPSLDHCEPIWQAIFTLSLTYGIGFAELAQFNAKTWLHPAGASPWRNSSAECPYGWIMFSRAKNGKQICLPLSARVRQCIDRLPGPTLAFNRHRSGTFHNAFVDICQRSGVDAHFGAFRKTCNDLWKRAPWGNDLPGKFDGEVLSRYVLGHASKDVNERYYSDYQSAIASVIDYFPYPWKSPQPIAPATPSPRESKTVVSGRIRTSSQMKVSRSS